MTKEIRITAIDKKLDDRDIRLYVLALIELARQLQTDEDEAQGSRDRAAEEEAS